MRKRRLRQSIFLALLGTLMVVPSLYSQSGFEARNTTCEGDLYAGFLNPPEKYKPYMLWWWVSEIDVEEAKRQIDVYQDKGAGGLLIYPGQIMRPHMFSEEWWILFGEILRYAEEVDFKIGLVPDFFHPQGDARDYRLDPPTQSRVLLGHPEYRLRKLTFEERSFVGPGKARFLGLPDVEFAIAARVSDSGELVVDTLSDVTAHVKDGSFELELGEGQWLLTFYSSVFYTGPIIMTVDPLNRDATDRYIEIALEEIKRRYARYLGGTFNFALLDSEGSFGGPLVSTPEFYGTFEKLNGYDIRLFMPLMVHSGGPITPKIRNDYFQAVTHLFVENYWKPIAEWCKRNGINVIQQSWGDDLIVEPRFAGDFMATQRSMTFPFVEGLFDWHRDPRQIKEVAAIANFEGVGLAGEMQLLQGDESYISPQKMRAGANALAAMGFVYQFPQAEFSYETMMQSPSWGEEQPHFKFFPAYSQLMQRIGYMNDDSTHQADIMLFKPLASVVASSQAIYGDSANLLGDDNMMAEVARGNHVIEAVEDDYDDLMNLLVDAQLDYNVVDAYYLGRTLVENGRLELNGIASSVLILPAVSLIDRVSMRRARALFEAGGIVIAYRDLPRGSREEGWDDPMILENVEAIFGILGEDGMERVNTNEMGGRGIFIPYGLSRVIDAVNREREPDFSVVEGSSNEILYHHRIKNGRHFYWITNFTEHERSFVVSLDIEGETEIWKAHSGKRRAAHSWVEDGRTVVPLKMNPWDGYYLVLSPCTEKPDLRVSETNLKNPRVVDDRSVLKVVGTADGSTDSVYAKGEYKGEPFTVSNTLENGIGIQEIAPDGWRFEANSARVPVRYAREIVVPDGDGVAAGFARRGFNDRSWPLNNLGSHLHTVDLWWMIGPWPNPDGAGFKTAYPPEMEIDFSKIYHPSGEPIGWMKHHARNPWTRLGKVLDYHRKPGVGYAFTYVYSPESREVQARYHVSSGSVWVNGEEIYRLHSPYGAPRWMRKGTAHRTPVRLEKGWNEILVKVVSTPPFLKTDFNFRLARADGTSLDDIFVSFQKGDINALVRERDELIERGRVRYLAPSALKTDKLGSFERVQGKERWYRFEVPPGTIAYTVPGQPEDMDVFVNGAAVSPDALGRISLAHLDWEFPNVIAVRMPASKRLADDQYFVGGETDYQLGAWTWTGLTYFSGEGIYRKDFELDPDLDGVPVTLDLGQVGVTAEVWLNDRRVGDRVWLPFAFDVTEYLLPGKNHLVIAVTNTDVPQRAEASVERMKELEEAFGGWREAPFMDVLDLNGLIGPVRLKPSRGVELVVTKSVAETRSHDR
jgi:hypothetical protein